MASGGTADREELGRMSTAGHPGLLGGPVYLDYNATTPVDARVIEAMEPYLGRWFGNPSSDNAYGTEPRNALAVARVQIAALIGAGPEAIVFTGSGSEADQLAIRGAVLAAKAARPHVITQVTEHPAVLESCRALERLHGVRVSYLPVDAEGLVDPADLSAALTPDTVLVSVMVANNETGVIQPIAELARIARDHGALMHCDAAQAMGKMPVDVEELGVDLLTVVGHKMYAPKGIAALYIRNGIRLEPIIYGGGQERGLRAGTENVALAAGLGAAARLAARDLDNDAQHHLATLRDDLHARLLKGLPGRITLNGSAKRRLPNTLNISIEGIHGHNLLAALPGIAASTGSACHSGNHVPSPVLTAMGIGQAQALAALRLTLGRWSRPTDIETAAELITTAAVAAND